MADGERLEDRLRGMRESGGNAAGVMADMLRRFARAAGETLGEELVGLYVTGSIVMGDYADGASDVDFLAVTARPLGGGDVRRIAAMHETLCRELPQAQLLEGGYAGAERLRAWGIEGPLLSVGPGEGADLGPSDVTAEDMWALRNASIGLAGPPARDLLPRVDADVLREGLTEYLAELLLRPHTAPPARLASNLLNIARCRFGMTAERACTKREAALWLAAQEPQLAAGLRAALRVRAGAGDAGTLEEVRRAFVRLQTNAEENGWK